MRSAGEDLADRCERHRVDEMQRHRHGRAFGRVLSQIRNQVTGRHRGAGLGLHVGYRQLARIRIGLADQCGEGDGRMAVQQFLQRRGVDVVAAADDQILGAAGDPQLAWFVDAVRGRPSSPSPARRTRRGCGRRSGSR